jgi:hypothetical protein
VLANLISMLCPVSRVSCAAERQAVFRLRYRTYIEELKKDGIASADHARQTVEDARDESSQSAVFYTGSPDNPSGTIRADLYPAGEITEDLRQRYGLSRYPELQSEAVAEFSRFVVRPDARGSLAAFSLGIAIYTHAISQRCRFGFAFAAPGLVRRYAKFGFRPYAANLIPTPDGIRVPLIAIASDYDFLAAAHSPLATIAKRAFARGRLPAVDLNVFRDRIETEAAYFSTSGEQVIEAVRELAQTGSPLLEGMPAGAIEAMAAHASILRVDAGHTLLRAGLVDRELYIVVEGKMKVFRNGALLAEVGRGEPIGEIAFFSSSGQRSADVVAAEPARLVLFGRRVVDRLLQSHPGVGQRLLLNLARVMAERLARTAHAF